MLQDVNDTKSVTTDDDDDNIILLLLILRVTYIIYIRYVRVRVYNRLLY